jgi:hypothetical protein
MMHRIRTRALLPGVDGIWKSQLLAQNGMLGSSFTMADVEKKIGQYMSNTKSGGRSGSTNNDHRSAQQQKGDFDANVPQGRFGGGVKHNWEEGSCSRKTQQTHLVVEVIRDQQQG